MRSTATANPVMTGHAVQFMRARAGFVGLALAPAFATALQSSDYYVWSRENALNQPKNLKHAPGAPFARSIPKISDDNYRCEDYGHEEAVPDSIRKKYLNIIDADIAAIRRGTDIIKVRHEKDVQALAASNSVPNSEVEESWLSDDSNPKGDVDLAKETIRKNTGLRPNLMVLSEAVRLRLATHPVIAERIKYTTGGITTLQLLAAYFEVDRIEVAEQVENTAQEGQAVTPADIWGDDVILAHVNGAQDLMVPNFARTFWWTEFGGMSDEMPIQVVSYRDEPVESDVHRVRHFTDEKIVCPEAGYRLEGALAALE